MSLDIENRLEEIEDKVDQGNKMLRSMQRRQTFDFWFGILKILLFIGVFYYAYVFIEPVYNQVKKEYLKFQGLTESVGSFNQSDILNFLKPKK